MSIETTFTRYLLAEAHKLVRKHAPHVKLRKDAWVYDLGRDHWEFHGPGGFYWHGSASNAYETRYKGWMAYLRHVGAVVD